MRTFVEIEEEIRQIKENCGIEPDNFELTRENTKLTRSIKIKNKIIMILLISNMITILFTFFRC